MLQDDATAARLSLAGTVLALLAVLLGIAGFIASSFVPFRALAMMVTVGVSGGCGILASKAYRLSKKHRLPGALDKLAQDRRPPVLYLRSFRDERFDAVPVNPRAFFLPSFNTREEQLVRSLDRLGPTVGIGKPGERLPELGAARLYVSAEKWQVTVAQLAAQARVVVIRAGRSPGLLWEEELVLRKLPPQRIVFILPDDAETYRALRGRLAPYVLRQLPKFDDWHESEIESLRAVLYFEPDWNPRMVDLLQLKG